MVSFFLGVLSSISFANHESPLNYLLEVPEPEAQLILACSELPRAVTQKALEKEIPNLKVIFFESGYQRAWLATNGISELREFKILAFNGNATPDFWDARVNINLPGDQEGHYHLVSTIKDIEKNGEKIHVLDVYRYDSANEGIRVMKMACHSFQTWI
jgi:hypothetical protein